MFIIQKFKTLHIERYELYISVRSVSCYVNQLREEYAIAKTNHSRDYESTYV